MVWGADVSSRQNWQIIYGDMVANLMLFFLMLFATGRLTVSGVHRGVQRALYDARRDELIPAHGIRLVVITPADLDATLRGRLRRNLTNDLPAVRALLDKPTS